MSGLIKETPYNINELKKKANDKTSWRKRLEAVEELSRYDCQQSRDILTNLALHDKVYKVYHKAFLGAQKLGVTKQGRPISLKKKTKGNLDKDINKKFKNVRSQLSEDFTLEEFKTMFMNKYPETYDLYEGDKGKRFDSWFENIIKTLPKQ